MRLKNYDPKVIEKVVAPYVAAAKMHAARLFNADTSAHDRLRRDTYEEAKKTREILLNKKEAAEAEVAERADGVAEYGKPTQEPEPPQIEIIIGASVIAATLAISIHDVFLSNRHIEPPIAWFFAGVVGLACGAIASAGMIGTYKSAYYEKGVPKFILAAGCIFSAALFLIRLAIGTSFVGMILSIGLSAVEFAVLLWMYAIGRGLQKHFVEFTNDNDAYSQRVDYRDEALRRLDIILAELIDVERVIKDHEQHLFEREDAAAQAETLTEAVEKVADAAATAAVMENASEMRGRRRRRLSGEE